MNYARNVDLKRGERIKFVRTKILGMRSQEMLAIALSNAGRPTTRGAVGNWELGKEVAISNLTAICELSGVDLNWLAYNKGEPPDEATGTRSPRHDSIANDPEADFDARPAAKERREQAARSDLVNEIDLVAGLGGGGLATIENDSRNGITFSKEVVRDYWRLPDWMLNRMNAKAQHIAAFPSQGDSMTPTINDGDVVFVDTRHRVPSPPGIYALADEFGGVVVKRLEVTSRPGDETVTVRVSSDNPHHRERELTLAEIHIIGRYIGRFTI